MFGVGTTHAAARRPAGCARARLHDLRRGADGPRLWPLPGVSGLPDGAQSHAEGRYRQRWPAAAAACPACAGGGASRAVADAPVGRTLVREEPREPALLRQRLRSSRRAARGVRSQLRGIRTSGVTSCSRRLLERVRGIPGVDAAGVASTPVLSAGDYRFALEVAGDSRPCEGSMTIASPTASWKRCGCGSWPAARSTADDNRAGAPHTVIVNQEMVRRCFGGRRIRSDGACERASASPRRSSASWEIASTATCVRIRVAMYHIPPALGRIRAAWSLHLRTGLDPRGSIERGSRGAARRRSDRPADRSAHDRRAERTLGDRGSPARIHVDHLRHRRADARGHRPLRHRRLHGRRGAPARSVFVWRSARNASRLRA